MVENKKQGGKSIIQTLNKLKPRVVIYEACALC